MPEEEHHTEQTEASRAAVAASDGKHMHVKVYAPFKVYFDGEASSISAVNMTGPFDVLPQHHNFMTLLSAGDIVVRNERGEDKITISRGVMHVKKDEVIVFLDV
jgi:F0F1-type ATP synthase epsilon subunit